MEMSREPDFEGFARSVMELFGFVHGIEAMDLHHIAIEYGMIKQIDGNFSPDEHIDAHCCSEEGDDWFALNFDPTQGSATYEVNGDA